MADSLTPDEKSFLEEMSDVFEYESKDFKKKEKPATRELTVYEEDAIDTGFEHLRSNKINQMGLGPQIIEMKRNGFSLQQISGALNVGYQQVEVWWKTWEGLSPQQKKVFSKTMRNNSVFNLSDRMEDLYEKLTDHAETIQFEDPQIYVQTLGEVRQTLKLAKDMMEAVYNQKQRQQEIQAILDEIRKASGVTCPECGHDFEAPVAMNITKRLQQAKNLRGLLS